MTYAKKGILGLLSVLAIATAGCRIPEESGGAPSTPVLTIVNPDYSTSVPCTLSVVFTDPDGDDVALQLQVNEELSSWTSYFPGNEILLAIDGSDVAGETIAIAVRVRDLDNHISEFSEPQLLTFVNQAPFAPNSPTGPRTVLVAIADTFTTTTSDPEDDYIAYRFDPGDGHGNAAWSYYYMGLTPVSFVYAYPATGTYVMRAQARDPEGNISAWSSGLSVRVINQPAFAGSVTVPGGANEVQCRGAYAYLGTNAQGIQVADVSNPHSPQIVGGIGTFTAAKLRLAGNTLLALVTSASTHDSVLVFDIANGNQPQRLGGLEIAGAGCLDAEGGYAVVGTDQGLTIVDIGNPNSVHVVGALFLDPIRGVALRFPYVYVLTTERELKVVDISAPSTPTEVASMDVSFWSSEPLYVHGERLRLADWGAMQVYNISNPVNPQLIAMRATHGAVYDMHASDRFLAIAEGSAGFELQDISQPGRPPLVGQLPVSPSCEGVFCGPSQLYLAAAGGGLRIYDYPDIGEPPAPQSRPNLNDLKLALQKVRVTIIGPEHRP